MSGNSIGKLFTVTTAGESHGKALVAIVDGCPPGMKLQAEDLQKDLDLRKPGTSRHTTQRREKDKVEILSGTFTGITTGTPIALIIYNEDQREKDYKNIAKSFRPGHADYSYYKKYGIRDYRGGGRSSARETAMRVAAGAIAKKYLKEKYNIDIIGYIKQLGPIKAENFDATEITKNPFFFPDKNKITALEEYMDSLRKSGDSIGANIKIMAKNMPTGLGEPIFDRLEADIAHAMMSINAVKGIEVGSGFKAVNKKGSELRDAINENGFTSNNNGGTLGGISSGQDLLVSIALKPTSSLRLPIENINEEGNMETVITKGRHDPCVGIRATPIANAMLAIVIMDHVLRHRAQNYDHIK